MKEASDYLSSAERKKRKEEMLVLVRSFLLLANPTTRENDIQYLSDQLAHAWIDIEELSKSNKELHELVREHEQALHIFSEDVTKNSSSLRIAILEMLAEAKTSSARALLRGIEIQKRSEARRRGKAGAAKRHAPMAQLRQWTIDQFKNGTWASANRAAHELKNRVLQHGRTIGAHLTEENAQRTIAEWIRKSV